MKSVTVTAVIFGETCSLDLMDFDDDDRIKWKELFDSWKKLKVGLRDYKSREPNFPEGLSEVAYCLWSGSKRFIEARGLSNKSFDTVDTESGLAEQVKACSVSNDLTSFGPSSKWDKLIFMDFYNDGKVDGGFDVYEIDTQIVYNHKVNRNQTFNDQQLQGRRPRLSIKELIKENNIQPLAKNVKVWL